MTTTQTRYGIHPQMGPQEVTETLADNGDTIYTEGSWIDGTVECSLDDWRNAGAQRREAIAEARNAQITRAAARDQLRATAAVRFRELGFSDDELAALNLL